MKIAYFDCFSGISGDMIVGALLDAGGDFHALQHAIASLKLPGVTLQAQKIDKKGVMAAQFRVLENGIPAEAAAAHAHAHETDAPHKHEHEHGHHEHSHEHEHKHGHHHHHHEHSHEHGHEHHHHHRNLHDITHIIQDSALPDAVKDGALATFQRLGEAEAAVHGTTLEEIHFHEVGAVDSIVDIVAAEFLLHQLGIESVEASPLHVGAGTVKCAHGIMPVPAPATARLLRGAPTYGGDIQGELVTPTGAALITRWARNFGAAPTMVTESIGYGSGNKNLPDRANVVRVQIGAALASPQHLETIHVIEVTLDDMNGEFFPPLMEAVLAAGARDVHLAPVIGKKGRPAQVLTILADAKHRDAALCAAIENSTTLGARMREEKRVVLHREWKCVETKWGKIRIKLSSFHDAGHTAAPEYEDCAAAAVKAGVPVRRVYEHALAEALKGNLLDV